MKIRLIVLIGLLSLVAAEDQFKSRFKSKREFSTNQIFKPGEYTIEEINNRDGGKTISDRISVYYRLSYLDHYNLSDTR